MQKNIGSVMGLYPTPVTVCGTVIDGKVNWLTVAHVGVVDHKILLISIDKNHELTNKGIKDNKTVSVSLVNKELLEQADYVGIAKVSKTDKSNVFKYHFGDLKTAPIIDNAPLVMECEVIDIVEVESFNNYILRPVNTFVQEEYLNDKGKVNYEKISPVLFEFQNAQYLSTGEVIGKCWSYGKDFNNN